MADNKFVIPARLPSAPEKYDRINEQKFRRILELMLRKVEDAHDTEGDDGGTLPRRRVTRIHFDGVNPDGTVTGEAVLPGTAGSVLLDVRAYQELWMRVYASEADRTLDEARTRDQLPPTTPIILDVLFTDPSPAAADPIANDAFVAGPGCTNSGGFDSAFDGDDDTCWSAGDFFLADTQSVGDTFSIDMGAQVEFERILMADLAGTASYPDTVSVETSEDGSAWTMQLASVTCAPITEIELPTAVTARYIRIKIVTINAGQEWAISALTVYAPAALVSRIRLFDGDVEGVLAFNWDNPAENKLYYAVEVADVSLLGKLYADTFAKYTSPCTIRAFFLDPTGGMHIVWGDPETNVDNCDVLNRTQPAAHQHTAWDGADYVDQGLTRPNYYYDHYQLRGEVGGTSIARFRTPPDDRDVTGFRAEITRGGITYDPPSWGFTFYAYLANTGTVGSWDEKARVGLGIRRTSGSEVAVSISWWDDDNVETGLVDIGGVSLPLNTTVVFTGTIQPDAFGHVYATIYREGVEVASAPIPDEIRDLIGHDKVGIGMTNSAPPDAELVEPDWGLASLVIYGADAGINVDIGYTPIERPGGTLAAPAS